MPDTSVTLAELIRRAMASELSERVTNEAAVIVAYDATTRTADVQLVTNFPVPIDDEEDTTEPLPIIPDVPVMFPAGGGFEITWPLVPGDPVLLLGLRLSADEWRRTGTVPSDPGDTRLHHLANVVALPTRIPGVTTAPAEPAALVIAGPDVRLGSASAADYVALASKVDAELQAIATTLTSGSVAAAPGPVVFGSPYVYVPPPGGTDTVGATKVKAE